MSITSPSGEPRCLAYMVIDQLSPPQQVAMLTLRNCTLSRAVLRKLRSSTVRAGVRDYDALVEMSFAERGCNPPHHLTGLGRIMAGELVRALAKRFEVQIGPPPPRARSRNGIYEYGVRARFNFY